MSRIHEAMKRAAEGQADTVQSEPVAPVAELDMSELLAESFPIEMAEHRRAKVPVAAAVAAIAPSGEPSVATSKAGAHVLPTEPGKRLALEPVAVRYEGKTLLESEVTPASREQYRRLAMTLHHAQAARDVKLVVVTSAIVSEGKTLTSSNLAVTLSDSYKKRVLLIDADLRRPAVHALFGLPPGSGLSDGLSADDGHTVSVRQVSPRLAILPAGRPTSDPMGGLTSERMQRLLEDARESFDWVIVDTPPVTLLPDANLLAAMVDGTLLVVRAGHTSYELVQRAADSIGRERILGIVLNQAASSTNSYGYSDYYYNYYSPHSEASAQP